MDKNLIKLSGALPVDKPSGLTSREVVDRVQDFYGGVKAGHGGTLDRLATGVLPVLIEEATKLVPYLHERYKDYRAVFRFDCTSDTLDTDGEVRELEVDEPPAESEVTELLADYSGTISQVPPRYSAVKQNGKRASDRVRNGEDVELESRQVQLYDLQLLAYDFPELELKISCGKGFYVRALARDLAAELGLEGGLVESLTRTRYGPFELKDAVPLSEPASWTKALVAPAQVLDNYPTLEVEGRRARLLANGTPVAREADPEDQQLTVAVDENSRLLAVLRPEENSGEKVWQPARVFNLRDSE